jgi:glycosyltransferase involved in cell wall biosynthesis
MSQIRPLRIGEALARQGHSVDLVLDRYPEPRELAPRLREIPSRLARWNDYDVVKTHYTAGFETLVEAGGDEHPFIISRLVNVVGAEGDPGLNVFGVPRHELLATQTRIAERARLVVVTSEGNARAWRARHGRHRPVWVVPSGVDDRLPTLGPSPYPALGLRAPVALFAGNLRTRRQQPEVNQRWQERLNALGRALGSLGIRLVAMGSGVTDLLDPEAVLHVGPVAHAASWDWLRHAQVGVVFAEGPADNNEKSRIYYYLRTALPVVCERPVENHSLVEETGHGVVVPYDDVSTMAAAVAELVARPPRTPGLAELMVAGHSWDVRASVYDALPVAATGPTGETARPTPRPS